MVLIEQEVPGTDLVVYNSTKTPLTVLADKPIASTMCPICEDVLVDPMIGACGHPICYECMNRHTRQSGACFTCGSPLEMADFHPDKVAAVDLDDLRYYCRFALGEEQTWDGTTRAKVRYGDPHACNHVVRFPDRKKHEESCPYGTTKCLFFDDGNPEHQCGQTMIKKDLVLHQRTCIFRLVKCHNAIHGCAWEGSFKNLAPHMQGCSAKPEPCRNGCGVMLRSEEVEGHQAKCAFATEACGGEDKERPEEKCPYKCRRQDIHQHRAICKYVQTKKCKYCKNFMSLRSVDRHEAECQEFKIKCPDCNQSVRRRKMAEHRDKLCPQKVVDCQYAYLGCKTRMKQSQMAVHVEHCYIMHMGLMEKYMRKLHDEQTALRAEMGDVQAEVGGLRAKVQELSAKIDVQEETYVSATDQVREANEKIRGLYTADLAMLRDHVREQGSTFAKKLLDMYDQTVTTQTGLAGFQKTQTAFNAAQVEKLDGWMGALEGKVEKMLGDMDKRVHSNYDAIVEGLRDEHAFAVGKVQDVSRELQNEISNLQASTHARIHNVWEHVQRIGRKYI